MSVVKAAARQPSRLQTHLQLHPETNLETNLKTNLLPDSEVLAALASGSSAETERAVSLRTRRAVFNAAHDMRADRAQGHRNLFIALVTTGVLTLLLVPAIWSGLHEILSGATLVDLPVMLAALCMMLLAGVGASLFLLRDDRRVSQSMRHHRR